MRRLFAIAVAVAALLGEIQSSESAGPDYPVLNTFHDTKNGNHLMVICDKLSDNEISCDFSQFSVWKKARPEDLPEELKKVDQMLEEGKSGLSEQECSFYSAMASGKTPKGANQEQWNEHINSFHPQQHADFANMMQIFDALCNDFSKKTVEDFVRWEHERNTRTCKLFSHLFTQKFTRGFNTDTWISHEQNQDECGAINIGTFKKATDADLFWTYSTRKVITNKEAKQYGTIDCSGFDETEYFYSWKSEEAFMNCDYIIPGP